MMNQHLKHIHQVIIQLFNIIQKHIIIDWNTLFKWRNSGDGGSLDKGSCSFSFEGEQRVLPTADGDIMPDEQRSSVLDG